MAQHVNDSRHFSSQQISMVQSAGVIQAVAAVGEKCAARRKSIEKHTQHDSIHVA